MIGVGRSKTSPIYFPALCQSCQQITSADIHHKPPVCCQCSHAYVILYSDESLLGTLGERVLCRAQTHSPPAPDAEETAGQPTLEIRDGEYFCPACRQRTLQFEEGDLVWD
jgi:Zn finger protein HypA/HybF involved in hydrogenase expression